MRLSEAEYNVLDDGCSRRTLRIVTPTYAGGMRTEGLVTLPSRNARCYGSGHEQNAYRGHRFPPTIIQVTVWMCARFTLSLRDVEELLAERGLDISYETVRRWFLKLAKPMPAVSEIGDIGQQTAGISTNW